MMMRRIWLNTEQQQEHAWNAEEWMRSEHATRYSDLNWELRINLYDVAVDVDSQQTHTVTADESLNGW